MTPLVNLDLAQLSRQSDGTVTVDDPDSPLLLTVTIGGSGRISDLRVTMRHPTGRISSATLERIPVAQIQRTVAAMSVEGPDETWWRSTAAHRGRSWSDDHWERVLAVEAWALAKDRPGGGAKAIADLWGISKNPTAYRWLREARRRLSA